MQPLSAARLFTAQPSPPGRHGPGSPGTGAQHGQRLRSSEDLIADLLDISRLENGRILAAPAPFSLATLFEALGSNSRPGAESGHQPALPQQSAGGQQRQQAAARVRQNFLTNALRYAQAGYCSAVRRQGQHVSLEVWDSGPASRRTSSS